MLKKTLSFFLSIVFVATLCGVASAVEERASKTLSYYNVSCKAGGETGELRISYDVRANKTADSVGVSTIELYSSGGVYITTILGSEENGLIHSDRISCMGTYSHTAVPGNSYYAIVTVFAEIGNDYDSRMVSTGVVTAPVTSTTP